MIRIEEGEARTLVFLADVPGDPGTHIKFKTFSPTTYSDHPAGHI